MLKILQPDVPRTLSALPVYATKKEMQGSPGFQVWAENAWRRHGRAVRIVLPNDSELVLLSDPAHNDVFRRNPQMFRKEVDILPSAAAVIALLLKDSVTSSNDGALWKERRSQAAPLMRLGSPSYSNALRSATEQLLDDLVANGGKDPLWETCAIWAARTVSKPMLGNEIDDGEALAVVEGLLQTMFHLVREADDEPDIAALRDDERVRRMREMTTALVESAISSLRPGDTSMVAMLAERADPGHTREDLRDELVPVVSGNLVASIHTTALSLLWTLFQLSTEPSHAERIAKEAEGVDPAGWHVNDLPQALAAVRETLRITPIVPFIERVTNVPVDFRDVLLPADTTVVFSPWLVQRDPEIWPIPLKFDPSRFSVGQSLDFTRYFPFGLGPRGCMGMNFALPQLAYAVSRICADMKLELSEDCKPSAWKPTLRILLETRSSVHVKAKRRRDQQATTA
jgi:cytochrome P450